MRTQKRILPKKHTARIESMSFSPDGRFLVSASGNEIFILLAEVRMLGMNELVFGVCSHQHLLGFLADIF